MITFKANKKAQDVLAAFPTPDKPEDEPITDQSLIEIGFERDQDGILCLDWPGGNWKFYWILRNTMPGFIQVASGYAPMFNLQNIKSIQEFLKLYFLLIGTELKK